MATLTGTFTATGESDPIPLYSGVTMILGFGGGEVTLQMSQDGGDTWYDVETFDETTVERINATPEGHLFRLNCTTHSGDIFYRIG